MVKLTSILHRLTYRTYNTDVDRWDPFTGGASAVVGSLTDMTVALGRTFIDPYKAYNEHRLQTADQQQGSVGGAVGSATMASGKGLGRLYGAMAKGALLDLPLALTEGLRNAPRLYGAEADDYGRAKDWKSGCVVGGKVSTGIPLGEKDLLTFTNSVARSRPIQRRGGIDHRAQQRSQGGRRRGLRKRAWERNFRLTDQD